MISEVNKIKMFNSESHLCKVAWLLRVLSPHVNTMLLRSRHHHPRITQKGDSGKDNDDTLCKNCELMTTQAAGLQAE